MATQAEVAQHLGLSERQIRNLQKTPGAPVTQGRGVYDLDQWRYWYINYLRKLGPTGAVAPPRDAPGPLDEDEALEREERQLKIEERRLKVRLGHAKLVQFEKSYAPIELLTAAIARTASILRSRHEGLIPKMKIAWPDMPPAAVEVLEGELVAAANECADSAPDLADYLDGDPAGDLEGLEFTAEDAAD